MMYIACTYPVFSTICPLLLASHLGKPSWSHVRHIDHHAVSEVCLDSFRKADYTLFLLECVHVEMQDRKY